MLGLGNLSVYNIVKEAAIWRWTTLSLLSLGKKTKIYQYGDMSLCNTYIVKSGINQDEWLV